MTEAKMFEHHVGIPVSHILRRKTRQALSPLT
jgi:hypothetical protein